MHLDACRLKAAWRSPVIANRWFHGRPLLSSSLRSRFRTRILFSRYTLLGAFTTRRLRRPDACDTSSPAQRRSTSQSGQGTAGRAHIFALDGDPTATDAERVDFEPDPTYKDMPPSFRPRGGRHCCGGVIVLR